MATLIPTAIVTEFTGAAMDHFDTFKRNIIVYKEPLTTFSNPTDNVYAGFEQPESSTSSYTVQTGVFSALKVVPKQTTDQTQVPLTQISILYTNIRIKVQEDAKKYIEEGKTEAIVFGGVTYNVISPPIPVDFLGLTFYYYDLQKTN